MGLTDRAQTALIGASPLHGVYALIGPLPEAGAKQGREECMAKGHSDRLASEGGEREKERKR